MVMLYLCFSKYCMILGLVTKLRWQLDRVLTIYREMQKHRVKEYNKQVGTLILFYFNHGCLRAKEASRQKLVLNT